MGLTLKRVASLLARGDTGKHIDRSGLYLVVTGKGKGHWSHRYQYLHRKRWMGLGSVAAFNLLEARELNRKALQERAAGIDPLTAKRARQQAAAAAANAATKVGDVSRYGGEIHHRQSRPLGIGAARPAMDPIAAALRAPDHRQSRRRLDRHPRRAGDP